MKPLAFRLRIALLSAAISGGVLLTFGGAAWYLMHRERVAALDRELRALAHRHPGWMGGRANYERLASTIEFVFGEDRKEQLILWVTDITGQVRYRSPHWPAGLTLAPADLELADDPTPPGAPRPPRRGPPWASGAASGSEGAGTGSLPAFSKLPRFRTVHTQAATWRLGVLGDGSERLVMALDCADLHRELVRMRNAFLVALPLALLVIGSGGWWVAGHALRPLRSIARVAEGMTARGLDQRMAPSEADPEITALVRVLNGMMDRLEAGFRQATRFSADASHELKTPLAVMQGELEAAVQSATPGSHEQQVFAELLEQTQRLKSITRSLLLLAQADAGSLPLTRAPLDLGAALQPLVEDLEVLALDLRLRVESRIPVVPPVVADWSLLRQAVSNVLHNAVLYNEPDGWIAIVLEHREAEVALEVSNGGPGIPEADQPRVFDRFFRGDAARSQTVEGTGLGLSLAREIVRAHGGALELKASRPGHTCFRLVLPFTLPTP